MIDTLKQKWKNDVNYTCIHCLKIAHNSVINGNYGYVTDEELIVSSKNTLRHM